MKKKCNGFYEKSAANMTGNCLGDTIKVDNINSPDVIKIISGIRQKALNFEIFEILCEE